MFLRKYSWILTVPALLGLAGLAQAESDIVTTAARAGQFQTLVNALAATGLDDALKASGHFTVFAPTDKAFAKLPPGTLDKLLKPENREQLAAILKYHVVPSTIRVPKMPPRHRLKEATTLNGKKIRFTRDGQTVRVNDAKILTRNIACSNGTIQVIDGVLIPPSNDLTAVAEQAGSFKVLRKALDAAGLTETVQTQGPFTVLAPTDAAFAKLPKKVLQDLLKPANKKALANILLYHVIPGRVTAREAFAAGSAETLLKQDVRFNVNAGRLRVNQANVEQTDVEASNGLIHVIDQVLLPSDMGKLSRRDDH